MLVYRLEYADGKGIYAGSLGFLTNKQALARDPKAEPCSDVIEGRCENIHPCPEQDPGLETWWDGPGKKWSKKKQHWHYFGRREYSCGFLSEEQMLNWFPREGFALMVSETEKDKAEGWTELEIQVSVYKVPGNKVRKGKFQAMFRKEDAELVEVRKPSYYSG